MTTRQVRANRRNARKSTGPRTDEGKQRSCMNAVTHGVFCQHVVLDGEDNAAFLALRQHMIDSLLPQNPAQLLFVERIASNQWRTDRLEEAEANCYASRRAAHQATIDKMREDEIEMDGPVLEWWQKLDEVEDVKKDPRYLQLCSAMGQAAMTMNSLLGDVHSELERYQLMRMRLESSTHRAFRELRLLQADAKKEGPLGPSPYSAKQTAELKALARQLDLDLDEDEEEDQDQDEDEDEGACETETAQNEPNSAETAASSVTSEACDDGRAPQTGQNAPIEHAVVRKTQEHVADVLLGEEGEHD